MQTATQYIPAVIFLAIVVALVWAGFKRADRMRAKAAAQMDAHLKAVDRNTEAVERIAAAPEARNQNRSSVSGSYREQTPPTKEEIAGMSEQELYDAFGTRYPKTSN
jgi:hypothetical protein